MVAINEQESDSSDLESDENSYDIKKILEATGHYTCIYDNGISLGVKLTGLKGKKAVHVGITHVVDLRKARFGRSLLARQSEILNHIDKDLSQVLSDVGLENRLIECSYMTSRGRVNFPSLRNSSGKSHSMIHETRAVYVLSKDVPSSRNFSWLTDAKRVIDAKSFATHQQSDSRSFGQELSKYVDGDKWKSLEEGIQKFIYTILGFVLLLSGGIGFALAYLLGSADLMIPLAAIGFGGLIAAWASYGSIKGVSVYRKSVVNEQESITKIGDFARVQKIAKENRNELKLIDDAGLTATPLMAKAADAVKENEIDVAIRVLSKTLDECVRLSPERATENTNPQYDDEGLNKFIGLFRSVDPNPEDGENEKLAAAYTAITSHVSSPIKMAELLAHLTALNQALFDAGMLGSIVKASIDDVMNYRATSETLQKINEELGKGEDERFPVAEKTESAETMEEVEAACEDIDRKTALAAEPMPKKEHKSVEA